MKHAKEALELFFVLVFVVACHVTRKGGDDVLPAFDMEGHRGCRGLMPENTIPAMRKAVDLGVTTLEMDAMITKDKKVILSHDPYFNEDLTTKPDGSYVTKDEEKDLAIYGMTYAATRQFDVGLKPYPHFPQQEKIPAHKPLLADVIDSVEQYVKQEDRTPVFYNIETKTKPATDGIYHPGPEEFVDLLMQVINQKGIARRVIIQSFDIRTLQYLHKKYPAVMTALLIHGANPNSLPDQLTELGFVPTIYSPAYELVTTSLVDSCHQQNMKVLPWTIDSKEEINRQKEMGVDGIITDYPNLFDE